MRAVRLEAIHDLRVRELAEPHPGVRQVVIRVEACGVDGTDRHILSGEYPARMPVTLGHEFAGTIVAAGAGVALAPAVGEDAALALGSRVSVDPNIPCGICRECRRGEICLCPQRVALGVDLDGGLADYAVVPISQVYPLLPSVPAEWGALCEPVACCLHGLDMAGIRPGMSVAVLGGGVIGQLMVQLARLAGAGTIVLVTRQQGRRRLAANLGATHTLDPRSVDAVQAVAGPAGPAPGGVDLVLECAGTVETFRQALAMARRGGTVLIFGVAPQGAEAAISPYEIFARELRIIGSYLNPFTHGRAVELIASGRLSLAPLVTRRLALEEVPTVLASAPEPGEIKAMVMT